MTEQCHHQSNLSGTSELYTGTDLTSQDKTMVTHHYFIQAGTRAASTHSFSTRNKTAKSSDANLETIWDLCNEPEVKTVWLGVGGDGGTFTGGFLTIDVSDLIYFFLC